ncbi:MAG: hypothetical protein ACYDHM_00835 [Acidiferrobacterales bacterium]
MIENVTSGSHPDEVQFDLLRAGLLDGRTEEKASVLQHLAGCSVCRGRMARWKWIADSGTPWNEELSRQLRERRRLALGGRRSALARRQTMVHQSVAAIAAALMLALGIVLGLQLWRPPTPLRAEAQANSVPDLYSHIDFYLWVSREGAPHGSHENRS